MLTNLLNMRNKKGFTLVELIVVLVILAILAALLIPALTGYIDKANEKQLISETRLAVMATQTLADEIYATATPTYDSDNSADDNKIGNSEIQGLAEVTGTISDVEISDAKVTKLKYTDGGKTCTYENGAYSVD